MITATLLCLMLALCTLAGRTYASSTVYRVGVVPQFEQRKLYRIWRPVLDRLEQQSGFKLVLVGTPKIPVFESYLYSGKFDFVYLNPMHMLNAHEKEGYQPILNDGSRKLRGILVVHKSSGISHPKQLNGRELAMPASNALGASMLLRAELERKFSVQVQPRYVRTHSSVYLHVAKQLVPGGGGVMRTLDMQESAVKNELQVIHETGGIAPHPIAVHPRVAKPDREKFISAILAMSTAAADQALLARIPINRIQKTAMSEYRTLSQLGLSEYYQAE